MRQYDHLPTIGFSATGTKALRLAQAALALPGEVYRRGLDYAADTVSGIGEKIYYGGKAFLGMDTDPKHHLIHDNRAVGMDKYGNLFQLPPNARAFNGVSGWYKPFAKFYPTRPDAQRIYRYLPKGLYGSARWGQWTDPQTHAVLNQIYYPSLPGTNPSRTFIPSLSNNAFKIGLAAKGVGMLYDKLYGNKYSVYNNARRYLYPDTKYENARRIFNRRVVMLRKFPSSTGRSRSGRYRGYISRGMKNRILRRTRRRRSRAYKRF